MGVKIQIKDGKALIECTMCTMCTAEDHKMHISDIVFSKQCSNLNSDTAWPMGGIIIYDCGSVCVHSPGENLCDPDKAYIFVKDSKTLERDWKSGDAGQIHGTLTRMITGHSAQDFFKGKGCLGGFAGDKNKNLKYTSRSLNYHKEDTSSAHKDNKAQMTETEKRLVFRAIKSWEHMLKTTERDLTCRVEDLFPKPLACSPNDPEHGNAIERSGSSFVLKSKGRSPIPLPTVHVSCQSDKTPTDNMTGVIMYDMPAAMPAAMIKWKPGYIFFKDTATIQRDFIDCDYKLDAGKCASARLIQILTSVDVAEEEAQKRGVYNSFAVSNGHFRFLWNASPIERQVVVKAVREFLESGGRCHTLDIASCA